MEARRTWPERALAHVEHKRQATSAMITANDIYALGLAVGNLLRDVDPAKREPVLDMIRALERKAEGERPTFSEGDPIEYVTHAVGLNARNGAWVPGTFLAYIDSDQAWVRTMRGGPGRVLARVAEIRGRALVQS